MSDAIAPKMTDNEALRRILAQCEMLEEFLTRDYDDLEGQNLVSVTFDTPYIRLPNSRSIRCVITNRNLDGDPVKIHEEDRLVRILNPGLTWESPTRGKMKISVTVEVGQSAEIAPITYVRNQ